MRFYPYFKRLMDILTSIVILLVLLPLLIVVYIMLFFTNKKAGVFFIQDRVGKGNRIFRILKFKTMTDETDRDGLLLPDQDRFTGIGRFLRSTSLDELPQLINVLKGDMSIIGPRPLLVKYLPRYSSEQARRHEVRPGITGWAQCNGRNTLSWNDKFKLDVWYVDNYSLLLDMKILFKTIRGVLLRQGINSSSSVTMEEFNGSN